MINSQLTKGEHMTRWKFIGILFGVAIRTKKPLSLSLSSVVWKLICGYEISYDDLKIADELFGKNIDFMKSCDNEEEFYLCVPFDRWQVQRWNGEYVTMNKFGQEVDGIGAPLKFSEKDQYIEAVIKFKVEELDPIIKTIQRGMSLIIPFPCVRMFRWYELETLGK